MTSPTLVQVTLAADLLWIGVPHVTSPGSRMASRVAASLAVAAAAVTRTAAGTAAGTDAAVIDSSERGGGGKSGGGRRGEEASGDGQGGVLDRGHGRVEGGEIGGAYLGEIGGGRSSGAGTRRAAVGLSDGAAISAAIARGAADVTNITVSIFDICTKLELCAAVLLILLCHEGRIKYCSSCLSSSHAPPPPSPPPEGVIGRATDEDKT